MNLKIAILGTRGIPNCYGGFEQSAEKLSLYWVNLGHRVTVYNPDYHPFREKKWRGINIKHVFSQENKIGSFGNLIYDFLSLRDAVRSDFDIILNMGYAPSALFFFLRKKTLARFITNMDGIEWKRQKWNVAMRYFLKFCEKKAAKESDYLIADNPAIERYLRLKYGVKNIRYIPYGAELYVNPKLEYLDEFGLEPYKYFILVARIEPENNIDIILSGYVNSGAKEPFIVIGGLKNGYAKFLKKKYMKFKNIHFLDAIYDYDKLSTLRWFAKLYFHGHSVGGTNPSLLEAMASNAYIVAHNNIFNRAVLGNDAFYFLNVDDIVKVIRNYSSDLRQKFIANNRRKIEIIYNWKKIANE